MTLPPLRDMPRGREQARRAHLLTEMRRRPRPSRRPLLVGGLGTSALAGGLAAALVLAPASEVGTGPGGTGGPSGAGGDEPALAADPAAILLRAAHTAAAQPELKARPDQFLYAESKSYQVGTFIDGGRPVERGSSSHRKVWLSISGRRAGLITGIAPDNGRAWACDNPDMPVGEKPVDKRELLKVDLSRPPTGCDNVPAITKGLPTDSKAALRWLYKHSQGGNPPDVQAFTTVGDTIRETYVPPASLAAFFKAAAKIPGTTVTKSVVDLLGRKGIAVGQTWHGSRRELIFDPKTYAFLGERDIVSYDNTFRPSGGKNPKAAPWTPGPSYAKTHKEGSVRYSSALIKIAITDRVGQIPS